MLSTTPTILASLLACLTLLATSTGHTREARDPCTELVESVREARSLGAIDSLFQTRRNELMSLSHCAPRLESETDLPRLQREHEELETSRVRQQLPQRISQLRRSPEELAINRRLDTSRQLAASRLNELTGLLASPPRMGSPMDDQDRVTEGTVQTEMQVAPPTPQITMVTPSPIVPGTDVIIEGQGFGSSAGTVALKTQGQSFSLQIATWQDGVVVGYLSDTISGVGETQGAIVELQRPGGGQVLTKTVPFLPVFEMDVLIDRAQATGKIWSPGNSHRTLFGGLMLGNQWRIASFSFFHFANNTNCELGGSPTPQVGGTQLPSSVHVWSSVAVPCVFCSASCQLWINVEGPRGLDHGVESPI